MSERQPLRIVHCVRSPIGGIFRHIADLAAEQALAGHKVGLICDSLTGGAFEQAAIDRLRPHLELGVERLPMRREIRPSDLGSALAVLRRIRRLDPDVLHGHGSKGGAYVRLMGSVLRVVGRRPLRVYCPHGGSLHFDANTLKGRAIFLAERAMALATDGLIFVSEYERDQFRAKVGARGTPASVVHNGLAPEDFAPVETVATARDFLFIGMLRDIKGPDVFIRALHALGREGRPATAHIVGDGPDHDAYRALVAELGLCDRIAFHAPMPARQAFALARCVVVPSRAESLPYIVLEALAAEMPLIATAVGGVPEILDGGSDALVAPGDADALAAAMAARLRELPRYQAEAAERAGRLGRRFSRARMARAIERAYRSTLPQERADPVAPGFYATHE